MGASGLTPALGLGLALTASACGTLDPAVPMRLPDDDFALGLTGGVAWDEAEGLLEGHPLVGLDVGWLDGVAGLHAGLRWAGEADVGRVSVLAEATVWYGLLFGLGARLGWLTARPYAAERSGPTPVRPPDFAADLTLLVALPLPVWSSEAGALVVAPYARPGLRLTGDDPDPDDVRGSHEVGLMVRWTSFPF